MQVIYDEAKRLSILKRRGLDFRDAEQAFKGFVLTRRDDRADYGEERLVSLADCNGSIALIVWTPRGDKRRIVTMWKANRRERERYLEAYASDGGS